VSVVYIVNYCLYYNVAEVIIKTITLRMFKNSNYTLCMFQVLLFVCLSIILTINLLCCWWCLDSENVVFAKQPEGSGSWSVCFAWMWHYQQHLWSASKLSTRTCPHTATGGRSLCLC